MYFEFFSYLGLILGCGALFLSILKTSILLRIIESGNLQNWQILRLLIFLFLIGYVLTLGALANRSITIVELLTVALFLTGSLFVLLVVNSAFLDIQLIKSSRNLLRERNNDLLKLNTQLDAFLYSTAHDLRSPLASILGLVDLGNRVSDVFEKNLYLAMIRERVEIMDVILKDIIKFSKNKQLDIKLEQVNLDLLIEEILEELKFITNEKTRIEVNIDFENSVWLDAERTRAILYNLLSNAVRFQNPQNIENWIKINCRKSEKELEISVTDNGTGIEPEFINRIFDMFFKGANSAGSGLGLYITKEIVDVLGGRITVNSIPGSGTLARVVVPYPLSPFKKKQAQIG